MKLKIRSPDDCYGEGSIGMLWPRRIRPLKPTQDLNLCGLHIH